VDTTERRRNVMAKHDVTLTDEYRVVWQRRGGKTIRRRYATLAAAERTMREQIEQAPQAPALTMLTLQRRHVSAWEDDANATLPTRDAEVSTLLDAIAGRGETP
jgi:hypothetical protein